MRLHSLDLKTIQISDPFWSKHVDLVRNAIIPYQWEAMNDRIPDEESSHCLENFRIDPSQGTHFFQNITSLGVGYLSVDQYAGSGMIDFDALARLECECEGKFAKVLKVSGLTGFIDRNKGKALIGF